MQIFFFFLSIILHLFRIRPLTNPVELKRQQWRQNQYNNNNNEGGEGERGRDKHLNRVREGYEKVCIRALEAILSWTNGRKTFFYDLQKGS